MKKFFVAFGAALLMVGTFSSCNKGASNANVSAEDKALGDSAATIIGQFAGARSASDYQRLKEMQPEMAEKFSKEAFLKGLKQVLDADTAQMAYYQGLQMGLQLVNPIIGINQEACDTLNALCDEYGLENACQLVSDMILFCSDRAELVKED